MGSKAPGESSVRPRPKRINVFLKVIWATLSKDLRRPIRTRNSERRSKLPWTRPAVAQALEPGHHRQLRRLTTELFPVVRRRVLRVITSARSPRGVPFRSDAEDLIQEVFAHLFDNHARVLRQWDPARGASL
ncbi:MAG: hypothetical protein AAF449_17330, partial [Myxococcota bacterium]